MPVDRLNTAHDEFFSTKDRLLLSWRNITYQEETGKICLLHSARIIKHLFWAYIYGAVSPTRTRGGDVR